VCAALVAVALAACGGDGSHGDTSGPAPISTLAYVVTRCDIPADADQGPARQSLWVKQGEREPVRVLDLAMRPVPRTWCEGYGTNRSGPISMWVGAFQRLGVSPDGSRVVFEITDDFSWFRFEPGDLPEEQEGFFVVRADGSGLRRLGPHSQQACWAVDSACVLWGNALCTTTTAGLIDFRPTGDLVVFTDTGPDATGRPAPQVFVMDLETGDRKPVTDLPRIARCPGPSGEECMPPGLLPMYIPRFLDNETLAFYRGAEQAAWTVRTDGTELHPVPVVATGEGVLVPIFQITGPPTGVTQVVPHQVPENGPSIWGNAVREAFAVDGPRVLQLTDYGRSDTFGTRTTADQQRVIFHASADPLGTNPKRQCEWFSIGVMGDDLRQLTHFADGVPVGCNCGGPCDPESCSGGIVGVDLNTGSIVVELSCDPFGTNPNGGQAFAFRPDGSGLRQLTFAGGMVRGADGSLSVELPGPFSVASRYR
jgi:hypothetical protein